MSEEIQSTATADVHEAIQDMFSDYLEQTLPAEDSRRVIEHLDGCEACRIEWDEFRSAVEAISGLHKVSAPPAFEHEVAETIRRRSGGRFFGRRAFGDRVPFELLAIIAVVVMLSVYWWMRSSKTGSIETQKDQRPPKMSPGAKDALPQPR